MQSTEIRQLFVYFFEQRSHEHVPAAPIVNKEDATLMFTNAGMNQFKDFFLGYKSAPYRRAVSVQPCLRVSGKHNDLEEVGTDTYHHTMFEMLGNWSFGDYFKEQAIQWAWELLTVVYKLPEERLYVTIFEGDRHDRLAPDLETQAIWEQYVTKERILQYPKQENFWEMGDIGPCGPCTEIHIDTRPEAERRQVSGHLLVNQNHPQVMELCNLVFVQYNRLTTGMLEELPTKHVDTGMGLERLVMVLQGKESSYETDLFAPLMHSIATLAGKAYGQTILVDTAMRVIADHLRAIAFTIADGQSPSNVKAGYVIRRILRRAVRYGYTHLGIATPFLHHLVRELTTQLQTVYPHLQQQGSYIEAIVEEEEKTFFQTLSTGLHKLGGLGKALKSKKSTVIDGATAFELYDTYGFPLDLTLLIAKEQGLTVDEVGFAQALNDQRQRSKRAAVVIQGDWTSIDEKSTPNFVGYDQLEVTAQIIKYRTVTIEGKQIYQVVLNQTPFYPAGGGQVGDTGFFMVAGEKLKVHDTQKEHNLIIHFLHQLPSLLTAPVQAVVDKERRELIASNHTATHLLHAALKQVLGPQVAQRGSLVNDRLLRFDFSYSTKLTPQALAQVESTVNKKIRENIARQEERGVALAVAKAMGAQALFGEKYGDKVRVVIFNPTFSMELCGGTHVSNTGQLGFFKITAQAAVAAGVRRVEAVTAAAAERWVHLQETLLGEVQTLLKHPEELTKAVDRLMQDNAVLTKKVASYEARQIRDIITQLRSQHRKAYGVYTIIAQVTLPHAAALKQVTLALRKAGSPHFVVLVTLSMQRTHIAVALSEDLAQRWSQDAQGIVKQLATVIQGGGGGSPTFATAGGKYTQGLSQVLQVAEAILTKNGGQ